MKAVHCAAVDLGATSGRVIVGTWSRGRLELAEVRRFPNQFRTLGAHAYWDLPYLWSEVRAGLAEAKRRFPRLASVGCDSWAVDHVLLGRDGRPVPVVMIARVRTGGGFTLRSYGPDGRLVAVATSPDGAPVPPPAAASGWF